jgi:hypothetical protein
LNEEAIKKAVAAERERCERIVARAAEIHGESEEAYAACNWIIDMIQQGTVL